MVDTEKLQETWKSASGEATKARAAMEMAIKAAIEAEIEETDALNDYWKANGVDQKELDSLWKRSLGLRTNKVFVSDFARRPLETKGFRRTFVGR